LSVWIDDQPAGKVRIGAVAELAIDAGEHIVSVSMAWVRSRRLRIVAASGSRTDIIAAIPWSQYSLKIIPSICVPFFAAAFVAEKFRMAGLIVDSNWLFLFLFAVGAAIMAVYILVTWKFAGDYWAIWSLEPTGTNSPEMPIG
jgi:hypothetical protein